MGKRAIVHLNLQRKGKRVDVDVPLDITARELLEGLNNAYSLGINTDEATKCHVKSENPTHFMHGRKTLGEYGIMDGSVLNVTE